MKLLKKDALPKIIYALVFCVALPVALAFWARAVSAYLPPPLFTDVPLGAGLCAAGIVLIAASMLALRVHGRGLPMNGFPPPVYVTRGPYRLTRHPIYVGFCMACAGAAIMSGSGGGFWLVLPMTVAGSAALVWGFERPDLRRRFGPLPDRYEPFFRIPKNTGDTPGIADRVSALMLAAVPWIVFPIVSSINVLVTIFPSSSAQSSPFSVTSASADVMLLLAALFAPTRSALRNYMCEIIVVVCVSVSFLFLFPVATLPYVFPTQYVLRVLIAMTALMKRGRYWRWIALVWGMAVMFSQQRPGVTGFFIALLVYTIAHKRIGILRACVRVADRLANSLRTWRVGSLRIFNHAVYSGSAAFAGVLVAGMFAGTHGLYAVGITGVCTLVGGALWAQLVEGSPTLLRPFGYYGAILGGVAGALLAPLTGAGTLVLLAAFATASPVIVMIGRMRCLVQGCCHGRLLDPGADVSLGLCVTNPSSRVCLMSPLGGKPIHATPLYAIAANAVIALVLLSLWTYGARLTLILGLYFLLAGLSRFVEEAYRGEPQTRVWKRLAEYQWYAIAFAVAGGVITALPCTATPPPVVLSWHTAGVAAALGLLTAFAMSMDFPGSSRRFARLTG